jgi:hypothetical protein
MKEAKEEVGPGDGSRRGLRVIHPPWSDYPLPGCSPAEPDAVSPDENSISQ